MIRVQPAPEPEHFDAAVRQPGLRALAEMVGEPSGRKRGRSFKVIAERREDISGEHFPPYWSKVIPDLLEAYGRVCAYVAVYIEKVTGAASVDHLLAKSKHWQDAYEWSNYRLACSLMNARKGNAADVLDPFEIADDWFELELVGFQVMPRTDLQSDLKVRVQDTIDRLKLNDRDCCELRAEYAESYWCGEINWPYLQRRAPFVARQMERQGRC